MIAWKPGDRLRHEHNPELGTGRVVAVEGRTLSVTFETGATLRLSAQAPALHRVGPEDAGPLDPRADLVARLAAATLDSVEDLALRLDALHLASLREADGLGSFLGGRIRLFPHQLHVAERATRATPCAGCSPTRSASARRSRPAWC